MLPVSRARVVLAIDAAWQEMGFKCDDLRYIARDSTDEKKRAAAQKEWDWWEKLRADLYKAMEKA